jgi:Winged helix DNA-binding domain
VTSALSVRALSRARLGRLLLLRRSDLTALAAIEHLAGLPAQAPFPPCHGLWSRLAGFRPGDLAEPITSRRAARGALMRGAVRARGRSRP